MAEQIKAGNLGYFWKTCQKNDKFEELFQFNMFNEESKCHFVRCRYTECMKLDLAKQLIKSKNSPKFIMDRHLAQKHKNGGIIATLSEDGTEVIF